MRTFTFTALTVALLAAPAWATGVNISVHGGGAPVYGGGHSRVIIDPGRGDGRHGNGHGHGGHHGHRHGNACRYIPGHYETYYRQVWVPGYYEQQYVQPVYQRTYYNGVMHNRCVQEGYYTKVWVPGYYRTVTDRRWCEGYWSCRRY